MPRPACCCVGWTAWAEKLPGVTSPPALRAVLGDFAEFERTMIRQRVKAGLKRAVAQGVKLDRPKIDSATERKVRRQLAKGTGILRTAKLLGLGTGTVQRISRELHALR